MSRTADLEAAILNALADGPLTLEALDPHLPYVEDRRWIGVALMHLERDGRVRYPNGVGAALTGNTVVEAIR